MVHYLGMVRRRRTHLRVGDVVGGAVRVVPTM